MIRISDQNGHTHYLRRIRFPPLHEKDYTIRAVQAGDGPGVHTILSEPSVASELGDRSAPSLEKTVADIATAVADAKAPPTTASRNSGWLHLVAVAPDGELLAYARVAPQHAIREIRNSLATLPASAECRPNPWGNPILRVAVKPSHWRKGIGKRMCETIADRYHRMCPDVPGVWATTTNPASVRMLTKAGFEQVKVGGRTTDIWDGLDVLARRWGPQGMSPYGWPPSPRLRFWTPPVAATYKHSDLLRRGCEAHGAWIVLPETPPPKELVDYATKNNSAIVKDYIDGTIDSKAMLASAAKGSEFLPPTATSLAEIDALCSGPVGQGPPPHADQYIIRAAGRYDTKGAIIGHADVIRKAAQRFEREKKLYVAQPFITSHRIDGHVVSFRTYVIHATTGGKIGLRTWVSKFGVVRLAPRADSLVSNELPSEYEKRGPKELDYTEQMDRFPEFLDILWPAILEFAQLSAKNVHASTPPGALFLGIDHLADQYGKPWLLESNRNPGLRWGTPAIIISRTAPLVITGLLTAITWARRKLPAPLPSELWQEVITP